MGARSPDALPEPQKKRVLDLLVVTCDWGGGWEENEVARGAPPEGRKAPTRAPAREQRARVTLHVGDRPFRKGV